MTLLQEITVALCRGGQMLIAGTTIRRLLQEPVTLERVPDVMDQLAKAEAQAIVTCAIEIRRLIYENEPS